MPTDPSPQISPPLHARVPREAAPCPRPSSAHTHGRPHPSGDKAHGPDAGCPAAEVQDLAGDVVVEKEGAASDIEAVDVEEVAAAEDGAAAEEGAAAKRRRRA